MKEEEKTKRTRAFLAWCLFLLITPVFLAPLDLPGYRQSQMDRILGMMFPLILLTQVIFWFKGFFHWARAKGFTGWVSLIALLGPLAPVIMTVLPDRRNEQPNQAIEAIGNRWRGFPQPHG